MLRFTVLISYSVTLAVYFILLLGVEWVEAAVTSTASNVVSSRLPVTNVTTTTIAFSSAVQIAASILAEHQQPSIAPALPVPSNIIDVPEYVFLNRIAPALPPKQAGIRLPDPQEMVTNVMSWTNISAMGKPLASRQSALKVMVVGDSMSQGLEGDWTWRYRIWQWFHQNGINVEFVGPYKGTVSPESASQPPPPPLFGDTLSSRPVDTNGGYAKGVDSIFLSNSNHFAVWGRAAAVSKGLIQGVLEQHNADLVLLMLGFNDMGWFYSDAYGTIDSIETLVSNARAANSNLKFAIANVPQRTYIGGREDLIENTNIYNNLLPNAIAKWSTDRSPISLVDIASTYDCQPGDCPAGYDGLHPNAWGEFLIANAFSKSLFKDFKLGSSQLVIPSQGDAALSRNLPVPNNFQVFSSPQGVSATWDPVYGAHSYDVKVSIQGGGSGFSATSSQFHRWDSQWSVAGWTYAVAVRASAGSSIKGEYTATLSAVAKPQLAPPPINIKVQPTAKGITVTWDPPKGAFTDSIVEYNVIFWDWAPNHCQFLNGAAFKSSPAIITGLNPGTNYLVAVETWNANGEGLPALVNNAVPGAGTPPVPGGLKVDTQDPTSVRLTWTGSGSAGGYHVWNRNVNELGSKLKSIANITDGSCHEVAFLFPGVWNFAFAVSAYNGNEESDHGPEVLAPSPSPGSDKTNLKCAPTQPWCPGGGAVSIPHGSPTPTNTQGHTATTSVPTDTSLPIVTNGKCTGPDCKNGRCSDILCASFGCTGDGCYNGICVGEHCMAVGCIGSNCRNGVCVGKGCLSKGCVGPDCDGNGRCKGIKCMAIGCNGKDCGGNGICFGPNCSETTCFGLNCLNGKCVGPGCHAGGGSSGGGPEAPIPDPEEPEGCTTTTFNACSTRCVYASTTSSCSSICNDVEGCTVPTDKSTATTSTSSCIWPTMTNRWVINDPNGPPPILGQGGVLGTIQIMGTGTFYTTFPSNPPPPTKSQSTTSTTSTLATTSTPEPPPAPSPYYDCEGEELCSTTNVKFCDLAVNNMKRGNNKYTANSGLIILEGNCWGNKQGFGCSVKIRGKDQNGQNCQITGDDMWWAYQDIRKSGGCSKCGSKHFGNGCLVSIDYYYDCDNRTGGPNRMAGNFTVEEDNQISGAEV